MWIGKSAGRHGSFDPDIAKRDGRVRIRLDADKSCRHTIDSGDSPLRIGVVEDRGQLRSSGFGISESRFILFLPKFNLANLKMQSGKLK